MSGSQGIRVAARAAALLALIASSLSWADEPAPEADAGAAVWKAAQAAMVNGPGSIELRNQARLALPEGYGFVPAKEGAALMELLGNSTDSRFIGLIFPHSDAQWFVTIDYEPSGYIKDDDAKDWN